ncbi:hypothetical protein CsatA_006265 [Cannabis sativa]
MVAHHYYSDSWPYTIYVEGRQVTTLVTDSTKTLARWLKEALKSPPNTAEASNSGNRTILVGLYAEREEDRPPNSPYDLISLSIGSYSIIYHNIPLPEYRDDDSRLFPKLLNAFFNHHRVLLVGTDISTLGNALRTCYGVEIGKSVVDLKDIVFEKKSKVVLNLVMRMSNNMKKMRMKMDVDDMGKLSLGMRRMESIRRKKVGKIDWWIDEYVVLSREKINHSIINVYLCFLIGSYYMGSILYGIQNPNTTTTTSATMPNNINNKNHKMFIKPKYYKKLISKGS